MIARYHRHRIAAAIFEVTLSAQVTITHQRNPFPLPFEAIPPKLRSRSPMSTVIQIVGSFIFLYCPYYMIILWNSSVASLHNGNIPKSLEVHRSLVIGASILINMTSFINGIIYGFKSKVMRKSIQNYWRKKKTKSEINHEIQARTPSTCGSRRPSINTMGFFNRPISQRRLSETFIDLGQTSNLDKPHMKRIASEMSWRPLTLHLDSNSPTELMPHSSSVNTLQVPNSHDTDSTLADASGEQETFLNLHTTIKSYTTKTTATTLSHLPNMSARHSRSSLSVASVLFQKVFRIDLNDTFRRQSVNEPHSPLKSPQILITNAPSDDSDHTTQSSPIKAASNKQQLQYQQSLNSLFEKNGNRSCKTKGMRYEVEDKISDSDTESIFTPEMNSDKTDITLFSKRCFSLDETPKYDARHNNNSDLSGTEEQLLLSWPTTRKKYKFLKEYEPNVNLLINDRCEEPEVIL